MKHSTLCLLAVMACSNSYAVGNPQFLEDNIRALQQTLNSSEYTKNYQSQTQSMFDTASLVAKNISSGQLDQANKLSAEQINQMKIDFARKLSEFDQTQWIGFIEGFNNFSPIKMDFNEISKLALKFKNQ